MELNLQRYIETTCLRKVRTSPAEVPYYSIAYRNKLYESFFIIRKVQDVAARRARHAQACKIKKPRCQETHVGDVFDGCCWHFGSG